MEQMREIRRVYRADESFQAEEEFPALSFEEVLTASDEEPGSAGASAPPKVGSTEVRPKPSAEDAHKGAAVLQIASFREKERAEHLVRQLRKKGFECFHRSSAPSGRDGGFSRVYVGPLPNAETAVGVKERLEREEGYKDILIRFVGKKEATF
jgi:cell division septation protein DedD